MELERAHRVGQRGEHHNRPVVVRFTKFSDREAVLRNCSKLRGTNVFINEDLSPTSQAIKRKKMPLLRQARGKGKITYFRHTRLIMKERPNIGNGDGPAVGTRADGWSSRQRSAAGGDSVMGAGTGTSTGAAAVTVVADASGGTATSAGGMEQDTDTEVSEAGSKSQPQTRKQRARK